MVGEKIGGGEQGLTPEQRAEQERRAGEKIQQVMQAIALREAQIASIERRKGQSEQTKAKSDAEVAKLQGEIDQLRNENGIEAPVVEKPVEAPKSEPEPLAETPEPAPAPKAEESMLAPAPAPAPEGAGVLTQEEIERLMGGGAVAEKEREPEKPDVPEEMPEKSAAEAELDRTILDTVNSGGEFDWKTIRELHETIDSEKAAKDDAGETAKAGETVKDDIDSTELMEARAQGRQMAMQEIAYALRDSYTGEMRNVDDAIARYDADIEKLREEMKTIPRSMLDEARADLASMERKRQALVDLKAAGDSAVDVAGQESGAEVLSETEKPLGEQAAGGELNDNENPLVAPAEEVPEMIAESNGATDESLADNKLIEVTDAEMTDIIHKIAEAEAMLGEYQRRYDQTDNPEQKAIYRKAMEEQQGHIDTFKARKAKMIVRKDTKPASEAIQNPEQAKKLNLWERLKARPGFQKAANKVKAAVCAVLAGLTVFATAKGLAQTADAADSDIPEETPTEMAGDYEVGEAADALEGVELDNGAVSLTERQEEAETIRLQSAAKSLVEKFQSEHEGETLDVEKVADHLKQYIEGTGLSLEDVESRFNIADNYVIYCYDEYHGYGDLSNKVTKNAFGTRKAMEFYNNNDVEGGKQNLIDIMTQQPEVLAAQASFFRSAVEQAGLANIDWSTGAGSLEVARQIDEAFNGGNGGEVQVALLSAMKDMLNSEDTTIRYHAKTGVVISQYTMEGDGEDQTGHELNASRKERKDAPYMEIVHRQQVVDADGNVQIVVEMTDNAQECNNQGDVGNESTPVGVDYREDVPEPELPPEPEPELPPESELPPEPELPPDNGPELPPEPQLPPDENPTPEPVTPPVVPPVTPVTPVTPPETPPETPETPEEPEEPEPDKPEPEPDNPEPEPDKPEPEPDKPEPEPEETIKPKDPESLIDNANKGGTGTVTQTPEVGEDQLEETEPTIPEDNQEAKEEGAVGDETATEEEQQKDHEAQEEANEKADELEQEAEENGGALTDDEFEDLMDYFNSVAGGTGNSAGGAGEVQP